MRTVVLLILITAFNAFGAVIPEEYKTELKQMRQAFSAEELSLTLQYNVYLRTGLVLIDSKKGNFYQVADNYKFSVSSVSIIQNDQWLMYMDETDQLIVVKEKEQTKAHEIVSFDLAIEVCESVVRTLTDGVYCYEISLRGNAARTYDRIFVYAKKSNLSPVKVVFDYAYSMEHVTEQGEVIEDKMRMEIQYTQIEKSATANFSTDSYFFKNDANELRLKDSYKNFTLIDQRLH